MLTLAKIKEHQAKDMGKDVRVDVWRMKKLLKMKLDKTQYQKVVKDVAEARTRARRRSQERHKKKIIFLTKKHNKCCESHEQDKLKSRRHKSASNDRDNNKSSLGGKVEEPLVSGTAYSDKDLKELYSDRQQDNIYNEKQVDVYGQVNLDDDERTILQKRPKFAVYDQIKKTRMEEEFNSTLTKIRWDRRTRGWNHGGTGRTYKDGSTGG